VKEKFFLARSKPFCDLLSIFQWVIIAVSESAVFVGRRGSRAVCVAVGRCVQGAQEK